MWDRNKPDSWSVAASHGSLEQHECGRSNSQKSPVSLSNESSLSLGGKKTVKNDLIGIGAQFLAEPWVRPFLQPRDPVNSLGRVFRG